MIPEWIDGFIRCLAQPDVGNVRMEQAIGIKNANLPSRIFKYRSDNEYARRNLTTDTVWLCSPEAYNDPYDSSVKISAARFVDKFRDRMFDSLLTEYESRKWLNSEEISNIRLSSDPRECASRMLRERKIDADGLDPEVLNVASRLGSLCFSSWSEQASVAHKSTLRLSSFSETHESIIMWSHYAGQHSGYCLEYDLQALTSDNLTRRFLFPVVYSNDLFDATPYCEMLDNRINLNILYPVLAAMFKSIEWQYEKEWRLIFPSNLIRQDSDWRMPRPTRIFLGTRMNAESKNELVAICKERDIAVNQMRLAAETFTLESEPIV
jgi:hypothetical protein